MAIESPADVIGFGGAAGGGKSDALLGIALTQHKRAIIFRKEYTQLKGLIDRSREIIGSLGRYNGSEKRWTLPGGQILEFGACAHPGDEIAFQGRAHDAKFFDEATHLTRKQFDYLCGWLRSTDPSQRCRIMMSFNPPTGEEDDPDWVPKFFAPWLDRKHPNPAVPGELRWFVTIDGDEQEVDDGTPFEWNGETLYPRSRTFIPARVDDNPYYANSASSNYKAVLQSLPEPLRSKLLYGDFHAGREDSIWQIIPTAWVEQAQARWQPVPPREMDALGVDPSRGGKDQFCICPRHGTWFAPVVAIEGYDVPSGAVGAQYVIEAWQEPAEIGIDVIGVGASTYDSLEQIGWASCAALNSAEGSDARDRKTGRLGFINKRAEFWWSLRESLDPESGDNLAIPPDPELLADLCAPRWSFRSWKIQVESKEDIKKRIGRSPGRGESLLYAHATGGTDWVMNLLAH